MSVVSIQHYHLAIESLSLSSFGGTTGMEKTVWTMRKRMSKWMPGLGMAGARVLRKTWLIAECIILESPKPVLMLKPSKKISFDYTLLH